MLKIGTVMIGLALGCAIFIPKTMNGTIVVVILLSLGISLIVISPSLGAKDDAPISTAQAGQADSIRPQKQGSRDSPVREGRKSKNNAPRHSRSDALEPGQ